MIKTAEFRNFKSLKHVNVSFERLTAIVGPNASGKTSILEAIHSVTWSDSEGRTGWELPPLKDFSTLNELYCRGSTGPLTIVASGTDLETIGYYGHFIRDCWESESYFEEAPPINASMSQWKTRGPNYDKSEFAPSMLLNLDPKNLASPRPGALKDRGVTPRGEGLSSTLALIALNEPDLFSEIENHLRLLVPQVERLRFDRVITWIEAYEEMTDKRGKERLALVKDSLRSERLLFDMKGAKGIPSGQVSEGTLIALGLVTILMQPNRPRVVLIDDIDRGMHPRAQKTIVEILRKLITIDSDLQVIMTTHSPYLLNSLEPREVLLTNMNDEGMTSCASLIDYPDFDLWKDEMSPGEMWSMFGESWVSKLASEKG